MSSQEGTAEHDFCPYFESASCWQCCSYGLCTTKAKAGYATILPSPYPFCTICLGTTSPDPMWSKCVLEKFNAQKAEAAELDN